MLLNYTPKWTEWFYVFAPFQIYLIIVAILCVYGEHYDERNFVKQFFKRISYSLERATGYPGWSMAGALTGLLMLGTAAIGLYWDIGFHVDFGRDKRLLTPSHLTIVTALTPAIGKHTPLTTATSPSIPTSANSRSNPCVIPVSFLMVPTCGSRAARIRNRSGTSA